jgi:CRISPR-associated protein Cas2
MYVIVIYDVNAKRCTKLHKYLKKHLNWIQNSVFEGEITDAQFVIIKNEVKKKINKEKDSVMFYNLGTNKWLGRTTVGCEKNEISNMI